MPPKNSKKDDEQEQLTRIAIIDDQKCKPKKCTQECMKFCPVVRMGKLCVEVTPTSKIAMISEELCIGCGICVKKCPFSAIQIINLPKDMEKNTVRACSHFVFVPVPKPRTPNPEPQTPNPSRLLCLPRHHSFSLPLIYIYHLWPTHVYCALQTAHTTFAYPTYFTHMVCKTCAWQTFVRISRLCVCT
jgi:ferredoxin